MKNKNKLLLNILLLFILGNYFNFTYLSIIDNYNFKLTTSLKYISILACFILTLTIDMNDTNKMDILFLRGGLILTIIADYFLLISGDYHFGVLFFILVQIVYFFRFKGNKEYLYDKHLKVFLLLTIFYFINIIFNFGIESLIILSTFYAYCFICTFIMCLNAYKKNLFPYPNNYLILFGMILFIIGDINVGISYLSKGVNYPIYSTSNFLIWTFYLPSQILIALSGRKLI